MRSGASIGRPTVWPCTAPPATKGRLFYGRPRPPTWKDEEGQEKGPKEGPAAHGSLGPGPNPQSLPVSPWGGLGERHLESVQMKGSRWPHTHPDAQEPLAGEIPDADPGPGSPSSALI